ncbi:MAG TPA: hypothetical protein DD727_00365 [Clostridiales bacterium]|nr:hypothetical protein [Clostridiales bacterium]
MGQPKNYYQMLEIDENATQDQIKKAYFAAVRKFPPEKDPEGFKGIREAYDILSDPETRKEHNRILHADPRYEQYFKLGEQAYESGDLKLAVEHLKTARKYASGKPGLAESLLGIVYMKMKEYKKATDIYDMLQEFYPEEAMIHFNLAFTFYKREMYVQAARIFKKALELDEYKEDTWLFLFDCLFHIKDYKECRKRVWECTWRFGDQPVYYYRLTEMDILENRVDLFKTDLQLLVKLARTDKDKKKNIIRNLVETADDLVADLKFEFAVIIYQHLVKLSQKKELRIKQTKIEQYAALHAQLEILKKNPVFRPLIIDHAESHLFNYAVTEGIYKIDTDEKKEMENERKHLVEMSERLIRARPGSFLDSILTIKNEYPLIYDQNRDFYDTLVENPQGTGIKEAEVLQEMKEMSRQYGMNIDSIESLDELNCWTQPTVNQNQAGRNDPCPCGSGRKYKKCCGGRH